MKKDVTAYEKIVQSKVYSEHKHEFQEVKRIGQKQAKLQDELTKVKKMLKN